MKPPLRTLRFFFVFTIVLLLLGNALAFAQGPDDPNQPPSPAIELEPPLLDLLIEPADTGFVVSWRTAEPQIGWVEYGASWDQMASVAYDERGVEAIGTQHRVVIDGLEPNAVIYYAIISGEQRFDESGSAFKAVIGNGSSIDPDLSSDRNADIVQLDGLITRRSLNFQEESKTGLRVVSGES